MQVKNMNTYLRMERCRRGSTGGGGGITGKYKAIRLKGTTAKV
jgi:hypothetical protein